MVEKSEEDLREAFQGIASASSRQGDLDRVRIRANRYRRNRLGLVAGVLITILAVGLAGILLPRSGRSASDEGSNPSRAVAAAECAVLNEGVPTFTQFPEGVTPHGSVDTEIILAGSGFYGPASSVRVVWNAGIQGVGNNAPDVQAGPTQVVAEGDLTSGCEFTVSFTVPDVPVGKYPVKVEVYDPASKFSISSEFTFEVTG